MSLIEYNVIEFFRKSDEFLHVQFEHAHGISAVEKVETHHRSLVSWFRDAQFEGLPFREAKQKSLTILDGLSTNIGFEQLRDLHHRGHDVRSKLENARAEIDSSKFLTTLAKFSNWKFDDRGLDLETSPDVWLKTCDVPITHSIEPHIFKNRIFDITGFQPAGFEYEFKPSASGGFFMMSLQLRPAHFIGFGNLGSLFGLSTLAHEIGHSTTKREESLDHSFLSLAQCDEGLLISDENDSYLYESVFMNNAKALLDDSYVSHGIDFADLLRKRKAIQNNLHLLKHRMNWLYYSGVAFDEITELFSEDMKRIYPAYERASESEFDWFKYSTLDQPISRIGYLTAYGKVFAAI